MSALQHLRTRIDSLPWFLLFLLRVALGFMLIIKGIGFISHITELEQIIDNSRIQIGSVFLTHYIPYAHLLGGFFILIGLWTRFFCLIQLPVLIGAVFFINAAHATFHVQAGEFGFSIIVLLLLLFYTIEGSGPISVHDYIREHAV
jgi:putative oxidoreductase